MEDIEELWKEYCEGIYFSNHGRIVRDFMGGGKFNPRIVELKPRNNGYYQIKINKKEIYVHQIIAEFFIGENPDKNIYTVDHIDRNPLNNHINNLRYATKSEQNINKNIQTNNKTGHKNIQLTKKETYRVQITRNKKVIYDKTFETLDEAIIYKDEKILELEN